MKKLFLGLLFIMTITAFGQENPVWLTSFDEAAKISLKTNKPILANFTGSDWCGYCKVLKKEVFITTEFKTWSKKNVVLLELDFPRRTKLSPELQKQNFALKNAFNIRGFPSVLLIKVTNKVNPKQGLQLLGKTGYAKDPTVWIATIDKYLP